MRLPYIMKVNGFRLPHLMTKQEIQKWKDEPKAKKIPNIPMPRWMKAVPLGGN